MDNGVIMKIATSPQEIEQFQQLLFQVYCRELKWHDPCRFPTGIFTDEYDEHGTFVTILKGDELVGGFRLVRDSALGFPHEPLLSFKLPCLNGSVDELVKRKLANAGRGGLREITRLVSKRGGRRLLTIDFAKSVYWHGTRNGVPAYFMAIDMNFFLLCQQLHVPLLPIDVPRHCEGSWTVPCVVLIEDLFNAMRENNREIWEYMTDGANVVGDWREYSGMNSS